MIERHKVNAVIEVVEPDPRAMYFRECAGEVTEGRWAGSTFGFSIGGAGIYVDVQDGDESRGTVMISAQSWVGAILDAIATLYPPQP